MFAHRWARSAFVSAGFALNGKVSGPIGVGNEAAKGVVEGGAIGVCPGRGLGPSPGLHVVHSHQSVSLRLPAWVPWEAQYLGAAPAALSKVQMPFPKARRWCGASEDHDARKALAKKAAAKRWRL